MNEHQQELLKEVRALLEKIGSQEVVTTEITQVDGGDGTYDEVYHVRVGKRYGVAFTPLFDAYGGGWCLLDHRERQVLSISKYGRMYAAIDGLEHVLTVRGEDWPAQSHVLSTWGWEPLGPNYWGQVIGD